MIKDIALHLSTRASHTGTTDYAISLAAAFEAHVAGIAFALDPIIPPAMGVGDAVPPAWIDEQREQAQAAADAAIAAFEEAARRNGVSAESRRLDASLAGAATQFGEIARRFDLSIIRQTEPDTGPLDELIIEAALFESGRPLLIVPYVHKSVPRLDRAMVCWDGSRSAARAVGDALPLLVHAKAVEVVSVLGDRGKSDEIPGADIGAHLARHDLEVEVKRIPSIDGDVMDAILSHAADMGADLLVMGGYGHSRLREFILGGVTRGILRTMTVPTVMSH
jgi:nucleotide-binding universal stress UspA family protein